MDPSAKPFVPMSHRKPMSRRKPSLRTVVPPTTLKESRQKPPRKSAIIPDSRREAKELWNILQQIVASDDYLTELLMAMNEPILVIDYLNQIGNLSSLAKSLGYKIGIDIIRGEEYIFSTSLHSIGCHRGECRGEMGIQKLRLGDPIDYKVERTNKENLFTDIAFQASEISFLEVSRESFRSENLYEIALLPDSTNLIKIIGNGRVSKEIDDMIAVALFLRLIDLGKEVYLQSCDKYRWMNVVRLSRQLKRQVKENQVMSYFLAKEMMRVPVLLLMGFECAYDCTERQKIPHDASCMLIGEPGNPKYI